MVKLIVKVTSLALKSIGFNQSVFENLNGEDGRARYSHLRATAVAQILHLMPSYLPGLAIKHYARVFVQIVFIE